MRWQGMYKGLCFYSHFGNGDLFNSREIIKDIIKFGIADRYWYAHSKNPNMFNDIPELTHIKVHKFLSAMDQYKVGGANDLYINTWIGRDGRYVLPGIGCTLKMYKGMFNETLSNLELPTLTKKMSEYIPTIDYEKFNIESTKVWIDHYIKYKIVLISTGNVQSNQAINFDFTPVVKNLCEKFPKVIFVITSKLDLDYTNLFFSSNITGNGFDLNEISYLSLFADTIIGRSSGPYVFTQVKENLMNPDKKFMAFTKHINSSNLVRGISTKAHLLWSDATEENEVTERCVEAIEI